MAQLLKNIYGHQSQIKKLLGSAKKDRLPHALCFTGPSGIGRRKVAFALAQTLLCKQSHPACGECSSCISVEQGKNQNILFIQPDGLHIKVDTIRQIFRFLFLQSLAPARVIIIDSAHQMNLQSANSLLKILEEPPDQVYFILISSHLSNLPVTIRSRTQIIRFSLLNPEDFCAVMNINPISDQWLIQASQGSMDQMEKWKENKEIRNQAFSLLQKAVLKQELYSFGELSDLVKNREQALFVCLCWQQILRDACVSTIQTSENRAIQDDMAEGKDRKKKSLVNNIIHQDQKEVLNALTKIPFHTLEVFFQKAIQLEQDLKGYADSVLAFDYLFMWMRERIE